MSRDFDMRTARSALTGISLYLGIKTSAGIPDTETFDDLTKDGWEYVAKDHIPWWLKRKIEMITSSGRDIRFSKDLRGRIIAKNLELWGNRASEKSQRIREHKKRRQTKCLIGQFERMKTELRMSGLILMKN